MLCIGILKPDFLEANSLFRLHRHKSSVYARATGAFRWNCEKLEEVSDIEIVLIHATERGKDRLEQLLSLSKRHQVERHVAQGKPSGNGRDRDHNIAAIKCRRTDQRQYECPNRSHNRKLPILLLKLFREELVPTEHERTELEELDLLHVVVARQQVLEIVELPRFWRTSIALAVGRSGKPGFRNESRDRCEK